MNSSDLSIEQEIVLALEKFAAVRGAGFDLLCESGTRDEASARLAELLGIRGQVAGALLDLQLFRFTTADRDRLRSRAFE